MALYNDLRRAQLSVDYLHANSTTHEFLFGALAEMIDNSRDAGATEVNTFTVSDEQLRGEFILCFLDNGEGMSPDEAHAVITFGKSIKRGQESMIGQYGNGLKSGSMRIGNDLLLITKKADVITYIFLSRTFLEEEKLEEVIVPLPSFNSQTQQPYLPSGNKAAERHAKELNIILKYSPFQTKKELLDQADRIKGASGTLVMVYNLKLQDSGEPELDITSDPIDIRMALSEEERRSMVPERWSFRAYTTILYYQPRMKIYIQGKKVQTKRLTISLFKPRCYRYTSARFKTRSEQDANKAAHEAKLVEMKLWEENSKVKQLQKQLDANPTNKTIKAKFRKTQDTATQLKEEAELKRRLADRKQKLLKEPKVLNLLFGIHLQHRTQDGLFVYNCGRLIKMYETVGSGLEKSCKGIMGLIDIPFAVLEPTHNKQDFADAKEYKQLLRVLSDHFDQYLLDSGLGSQDNTKFWESFGYLSSKWKEPPSLEEKFMKKRAMQIPTLIQCDSCLQWRQIPYSSKNVGQEYPEDWVCAMNPDPSRNKCSAAQEKWAIPEGKLVPKPKVHKQDTSSKLEEVVSSSGLASELPSPTSVRKGVSHPEMAVVSSSTVAPNTRAAGRGAGQQPPTRANRFVRPAPPPKPPAPQRGGVKRHADSSSSEAEEDDDEEEEEEEEEDEEEEVLAPTNLRQKRILPRPPPAKVTRTLPARVEPKVTPKVTPQVTPKVTPQVAPKVAPQISPKTTPVMVPKNTPRMPPKSIPKPFPTRGAFQSARGRSTRQTPCNKSNSEEEEEEESEVSEEEPVNNVEPMHNEEPIEVSDEEPPKKEDSKPEKEATETSKEEPLKKDAPKYEVNQLVEVKVRDEWKAGIVTRLTSTGQAFVKLSGIQDNRAVKVVPLNSDDLRLRQAPPEETPLLPRASPLTQKAKAGSQVVPSTATSLTENKVSIPPENSEQIFSSLTQGYRTCLCYFLPPEWVIDREAISKLSPQELANFPLDDFLDHYEKGLRKYMSGVEDEAAQATQQLEKAQETLSTLRKTVARFLTTVDEEFEIDPNCETEEVDELLKACLQQVAEPQQGT